MDTYKISVNMMPLKNHWKQNPDLQLQRVNPNCILYVSTDAIIIFKLKTFSWRKKSKKVKVGGKVDTFPPGKVHKFFGK